MQSAMVDAEEEAEDGLIRSIATRLPLVQGRSVRMHRHCAFPPAPGPVPRNKGVSEELDRLSPTAKTACFMSNDTSRVQKETYHRLCNSRRVLMCRLNPLA